jgi:hypothetical protein
MRTITGMAIALIMVLSLSAAAQQPPTDASVTFEAEVCPDFPVRFDVTGKGATIHLPDSGLLFISPNLNVTLTNVEEPTNQHSFVVTGTIKQHALPGGRTEQILNGRNLLFEPVDQRLTLLIGHFRTVISADGTRVEDMEGTGQAIDVCALLA